MNAAERNARNDGYRFTGIYERDKEKLKQRAVEKRAEGFMVKTIEYSLYAKYKPLKPAEIVKVEEKLKEAKLELIFANRSLKDMENELHQLQTNINETKFKIWKGERAAEDMTMQLKDSGVVPVLVSSLTVDSLTKDVPMNHYHIETKDGTGTFNFLTQAPTAKEAIKNLETNSSDYKNIVKNDNNMTIKIEKLLGV